MGRKYTNGPVIPKGINVTSNEPLDQRTVVALLSDLYQTSLNAYPGMRVIVEESITIDNVAETLREYKFKGGDPTNTGNWVYVTSAGNTNIADIPLQFMSFVFKRNTVVPQTPSGGTYTNPVPTGWFDKPPVGTDTLWMSNAVLIQGSQITVVWATPVILEDTANMDYEYCSLTDATADSSVTNGIPLEPLESPVQRTYWHNLPLLTDNFMAFGTKIGGAYPINWTVVKITGEDGTTGAPGGEGRKYNTSIVFARVNDDTMSRAVITGGGFSSPTPSITTIDGNVKGTVTWSDGIPAGTEKVWMSKFTFNNVDHAVVSSNNTWTTPSGITDTGSVDFKFSEQLSTPVDPTTNPGIWLETATVNTIWIAQRTVKNGIFGAWMIYKVKGETGATGQGVQIAGRDTIINILTKTTPAVSLLELWVASDTNATAALPGVINDAYLYLGAGNGENNTEWSNIGSVVGANGVSYKQSTVFKRSITLPTAPVGGSFSNPIPAGWSDGIPTASVITEKVWMSTRFFADDNAINSNLADWNAPTLASDTLDIDFEYANMQGGDATPLAPNLAANGVWTNTGGPTSVWMAKAKILNGVTDDTTWEVLRIKGETGASGSDGVPSFLSGVFIKAPNGVDLATDVVTGGTYNSPIPTSIHNGKSWTDGVPSGTGALWFTQVRFEQTDTGNNKVWPAPSLMVDSSTVEYNFSPSITKPINPPIEGSSGTNTWYDNASEITPPSIVRWMAVGSRKNGVWPTTWDYISVIGETGAAGLNARTYVPSSMFVRADDTNIQNVQPIAQYLVNTNGVFNITGAAPTLSVGGTTYTFSDGIPAKGATFPTNSERVWMINAVFNSVDHLGVGKPMTWSYPSLLADNTSIDYQYHPGIGAGHTIPGAPDTNQTGWLQAPDANTYWIGQKNWGEGVTAQWVVYLIRGENGADGVIPGGGTAPSKVTGLTTVGTFLGGIKLSWTAATDVDGDLDHYELNNVTDGTITIHDGTGAYISGLSPVSFVFKVRAVDANSNKGVWSDPLVTFALDHTSVVITTTAIDNITSCTGSFSKSVYCKKLSTGKNITTGDYLFTASSFITPRANASVQVVNPEAGSNIVYNTDAYGRITSITSCI